MKMFKKILLLVLLQISLTACSKSEKTDIEASAASYMEQDFVYCKRIYNLDASGEEQQAILMGTY